MKRKTKHEIIDEVANAYTSDTRAFDSEAGACQYLNDKGQRCAVGRYSISEELDKFHGGIEEVVADIEGGTCDLGAESLDDLLDPSVRGHSVEFWEDVQILHDRPDHWTPEGLSAAGQKYVDELKSRWTNQGAEAS